MNHMIKIGIIFMILLSGCAHSPEKPQVVLFQVSTIQNLFEGDYEGKLSYEDLKKQGDFGMGTFEGLDGEMIAVDGSYFQIRADGVAYPTYDTMSSPFATVTQFKPAKLDVSDKAMNYAELQKHLDGLIGSKKKVYAFKITGDFESVKTRSIPKQVKPYPPIMEAGKSQKISEFKNTDGVMVGFYFPEYMKTVSGSGYHFHFISSERKNGGHLLDCRSKSITIEICNITEVNLVLP